MVPFSACTLSSSFSSQTAMCIHLCTKACNAHHRILLQCKRWYIDVSTMKARIGPCFSVQRCRRRRPSFSRQTFRRFVRNLFQRRDKDNEAEEKRNKARGGATEQSKRGSVGQRARVETFCVDTRVRRAERDTFFVRASPRPSHQSRLSLRQGEACRGVSEASAAQSLLKVFASIASTGRRW